MPVRSGRRASLPSLRATMRSGGRDRAALRSGIGVVAARWARTHFLNGALLHIRPRSAAWREVKETADAIRAEPAHAPSLVRAGRRNMCRCGAGGVHRFLHSAPQCGAGQGSGGASFRKWGRAALGRRVDHQQQGAPARDTPVAPHDTAVSLRYTRIPPGAPALPCPAQATPVPASACRDGDSRSGARLRVALSRLGKPASPVVPGGHRSG